MILWKKTFLFWLKFRWNIELKISQHSLLDSVWCQAIAWINYDPVLKRIYAVTCLIEFYIGYTAAVWFGDEIKWIAVEVLARLCCSELSNNQINNKATPGGLHVVWHLMTWFCRCVVTFSSLTHPALCGMLSGHHRQVNYSALRHTNICMHLIL